MERVWPCRAELQLNVRREKTPRRERDIDARASLRGASVSRSHRWCRPDAHRLNPAGFSFALAGLGQLLMLPFKLLLFRRGRTEESGGPPLFEPSLKVEGDIGHFKTSGLCPD